MFMSYFHSYRGSELYLCYYGDPNILLPRLVTYNSLNTTPISAIF